MAEKKPIFGDRKKKQKFSFGAIKARFKGTNVKSGTDHIASSNDNVKTKTKNNNAKKVEIRNVNHRYSVYEELNQDVKEDVPVASTNTEMLTYPHSRRSRRLFYGKALYDNIVRDGQEIPEDFDYSKSIADVLELNVPELVRKAELDDLILDDKCLEKLKGYYPFRSISYQLL